MDLERLVVAISVIASLATITEFMLQRWKEYRKQNTKKS
jgi:hypothetical protein